MNVSATGRPIIMCVGIVVAINFSCERWPLCVYKLGTKLQTYKFLSPFGKNVDHILNTISTSTSTSRTTTTTTTRTYICVYIFSYCVYFMPGDGRVCQAVAVCNSHVAVANISNMSRVIILSCLIVFSCGAEQNRTHTILAGPKYAATHTHTHRGREREIESACGTETSKKEKKKKMKIKKKERRKINTQKHKMCLSECALLTSRAPLYVFGRAKCIHIR